MRLSYVPYFTTVLVLKVFIRQPVLWNFFESSFIWSGSEKPLLLKSTYIRIEFAGKLGKAFYSIKKDMDGNIEVWCTSSKSVKNFNSNIKTKTYRFLYRNSQKLMILTNWIMRPFTAWYWSKKPKKKTLRQSVYYGWWGITSNRFNISFRIGHYRNSWLQITSLLRSDAEANFRRGNRRFSDGRYQRISGRFIRRNHQTLS